MVFPPELPPLYCQLQFKPLHSTHLTDLSVPSHMQYNPPWSVTLLLFNTTKAESVLPSFVRNAPFCCTNDYVIADKIELLRAGGYADTYRKHYGVPFVSKITMTSMFANSSILTACRSEKYIDVQLDIDVCRHKCSIHNYTEWLSTQRSF